MKHIKSILSIVVVSLCFSSRLIAQTTTTVEVTSNPLWTDTGVALSAGETVLITAKGGWAWNKYGPEGATPFGPDGFFDSSDDLFLDNGIQGMLIGYVGDITQAAPHTSPYIPVGSMHQFVCSQSGELWLGFNDDADSHAVGDNVGSVTAQITVYTTNAPPDPGSPCGSPYLSGPSIWTGAYSFTAAGASGTSWQVCQSSDLINWTAVGSVTLNSVGIGGYTDGNIAGVPYRFYKLTNGGCCSQAIGFTRIQVGIASNNIPGTNSLISNQLDSPNHNTLDGLFNLVDPATGVIGMPDGTALPDGSTIQKWDLQTQAYLTYTWKGNIVGPRWTDASGNDAGSVSLNPGEGAFLMTSNALTVTFIGSVRDGSLTLPLPGDGIFHLVGALLPKAGGLQTDLNYFPHPGDLVELWRGPGLSYSVASYVPFSGGFWAQGEPVLKVGQAFFWRSGTNNNWQMNFSPCQ